MYNGMMPKPYFNGLMNSEPNPLLIHRRLSHDRGYIRSVAEKLKQLQ